MRRGTGGPPIGAPVPAPNRFARALTEQEEAREAAMIAETRAVWTGRAESPESFYYQAPGLTADETAARIAEELCRVMVLVGYDAEVDNPHTVEDIDRLHRAVFEPVFGDATAQQRDVDSEVAFPRWVSDGPGRPARHVEARGTSPKRIDRKLAEAIERFDAGSAQLPALAAAAADGRVPLVEACLPPARLYADLIRIHPYPDGNGRTAWLALNHALIRCGTLAVVARPTIESRVELGRAIGAKHPDSRPLAERLAAAILSSQGKSRSER
jgi:hypothetical protein